MKKILSIIVIAFFSLIASAQVSQTVNVTTPGTLSSLASAYLSTVTNLTVTGNIDARDVKIMRDNMPKLQSLDISGVIIQSYTGNGGTNTDILTTYPVNEIPKYAFHSPNVTTKNGIVESWSTSQNSIISSIIFPISIVSIGDFAFFTSNISGNLLLPSSVTSIGIAAFYECNKITGNLTLSNNINNIGNQAFYGCYYFMGSLTIPASVTNIGVAAFNMCRFTEFVVHSDNKRYLSLNGVLFTANKETMVMCPRSKIGIIEIPNTALSQRAYQDSFIGQSDLYISPTGFTAIPFLVDPLVMYWNRTMFTNAGIAKYPVYWDEFATIGKKIDVKDVNSNIRRSSIAMGEFVNI
ncbi:MAG: leucine-rich repeat protein, partial [Paludibacter sp.]